MLHWVRCLDTAFIPGAFSSLDEGNASAQAPVSPRMERLTQARQSARRLKQAAAWVLPVLLGLGGWSASSMARAGDVLWSIGFGGPGVVVSAGSAYPVLNAWPVAPVQVAPPRVVYVPVPQPAWGGHDHRGRHSHHHHHGHHGYRDDAPRHGGYPPAFGSRWGAPQPYGGGYGQHSGHGHR